MMDSKIGYVPETPEMIAWTKSRMSIIQHLGCSMCEARSDLVAVEADLADAAEVMVNKGAPTDEDAGLLAQKISAAQELAVEVFRVLAPGMTIEDAAQEPFHNHDDHARNAHSCAGLGRCRGLPRDEAGLRELIGAILPVHAKLVEALGQIVFDISAMQHERRTALCVEEWLDLTEAVNAAEKIAVGLADEFEKSLIALELARRLEDDEVDVESAPAAMRVSRPSSLVRQG